MKRILCCTLVVAGCASDDPSPTPPADTSQATSYVYGDDVEEQGVYLLSKNADPRGSAGYRFWVGQTATKGVQTATISVVNGQLSASGYAPEDLEGFAFTTGTHPLRIDDVIIHDDGRVAYDLSFFDGSSWVAYCDESLSNEALPMSGRWTPSRDHVAGNYLTFACRRGGVAAKCIDWGYPAGPGGTTDRDSRQHSTCVQYASGDYCNNGIAHTRELTPIAIRDLLPDLKPSPDDVPTLPTLDPAVTWPPPDRFYLEGAWKFDGPVICLSKVRWAALPPGGYCPQDVPDPRIATEDAVVFCDELTTAELKALGATNWTGSMVMDIKSHAWKGPAPTEELVSTVAGYVENGAAITTPYEGYTLVAAVPSPHYMIVRNLPGSLTLGDVTPVYAQENPGKDHVVAPVDALGKGVTANHNVDFTRPEGYLLNKKIGPSLELLMLYRKGDDFMTALSAPPGYSWVKNLGYVLRI